MLIKIKKTDIIVADGAYPKMADGAYPKISWNLIEWLFQKLNHLTCSGISRLELNEINGFIEERHN